METTQGNSPPTVTEHETVFCNKGGPHVPTVHSEKQQGRGERKQKTLTCFIRLGPHVDDSHRDRENDSA